MKDYLRTERLSLQPFRAEDAEVLAAFEQDSEFLRLYDADVAKPHTADEIRESYAGRKPPGDFVFTVHGADDVVIGIACLDGILPFQGVGGMSIGLGRPYWGQGYGREILTLLLRFSFNELNLRRVTITVFDYNTRAIRLYERAGFVREGAFRAFLVRDGEPHDMLLYGMLRGEYRDG
jgi:RimJ/RimL family protein N-acetyltransferase